MRPTLFADRRLQVAFALGVIALVGGALAWRASFPKVAPPQSASDASVADALPPPAYRQPPTIDEYHASIRAALAPFLAARATLPAEYGDARAAAEASPARVAKEQALQVVVPAMEQKSHLALILALGKIEQGAGAREGAVWEEGEKALDAWLKAHAWAVE